MQEIKEEEFDCFIRSAPIAIVDFYATWCGPCKVVESTLNSFNELKTGIAVAKINVEWISDSLYERVGVRSVPTTIIFKSGEPVEILSGAKFRVVDLQQKIDEVKDK